VTRLEPALETVAPMIEFSFEQDSVVCVPHTPGKTQTIAIQEIRNSDAFEFRLNAAFVRWDAEYAHLWKTVYNDHLTPGGPCYTEEHRVVDPWVTEICSYALNQCWELCPACPPRPMGACCNATTGGCTTKTRCDCEDVGYGGIYQGNDDTNACGPPNPCVGACCPNGVGPNYPCTLTTASGCSGPFGGLGSDCTLNPCWPPG